MNKRLLTAGALLVMIGIAILNFMPEGAKPVSIGEVDQGFSLPDLQGQLHGLPEGKVVLLNFWATWCPPCRKEVPSMVKVYNKLKEKGLDIVAVSVDKRRDDVVKFVKEQEMNFTVLHDVDSKVAHQYRVFRYPETFIIDRNGVVRQHLTGAVEWMDAEFYEYLEALLAEPLAK